MSGKSSSGSGLHCAGSMKRSIWSTRRKRTRPALILMSVFQRCLLISAGPPSSLPLGPSLPIAPDWPCGKKAQRIRAEKGVFPESRCCRPSGRKREYFRKAGAADQEPYHAGILPGCDVPGRRTGHRHVIPEAVRWPGLGLEESAAAPHRYGVSSQALDGEQGFRPDPGKTLPEVFPPFYLYRGCKTVRKAGFRAEDLLRGSGTQYGCSLHGHAE